MVIEEPALLVGRLGLYFGLILFLLMLLRRLITFIKANVSNGKTLLSCERDENVNVIHITAG